jgi:hypothetical protein
VLGSKLESVRPEFRQVLIQPNGPIEHVYFMERGITSVLADPSKGRVEIGILGSEGMVGLPVLLGSQHSTHGFMVQA